MRVAALYDIHGNLPALEAVLADVDRAGPDLILVGGDVVSGPMPRETLERLTAYGERVQFIRGNADRELVEAEGRPADESDVWNERTRWAARQLSGAQRRFLKTLPEQLALTIGGLGRTRFCHGSPRRDDEIVTSATPERRLREILAGVDEDVVVLGHTHVQFDRVAAERRLVNPGSVGLAYEDEPGAACFAFLGPEVSLRRARYDVAAAAAEIRASSFPAAEEFVREHILVQAAPGETTRFFEALAEQMDGGA